MTRLALTLAVVCWPALAVADGFRFPGSDEHREHFYITAYRDNSGSGGGLQDWSCGTKTYDGHRGTDMGVGGFPGMDAGRDVVAAAAGTVTYVNDGVFDRCTTGNCTGGGGFGNYVRIEHADGKVTYYGHLKKFSITVAVGDTVACGQKLGQVGSSGYSTGPHLHFEPRVNNVSDDPFSGSCAGPTSWWVDQGSYLGLPEALCANAPPAHPLLSLGGELAPAEGFEADFHPEGDSAGIFDVEAGQIVTARFSVTNDATDVSSPNVIVGVEASSDYVELLGWEVLDNYPGNACGGELCPNDANENPENPPHDRPGEAFDLHLNAFAAGEIKVLVLTLRARAPTSGQAPHAELRMWVKHVEGSYAKTSFDAAPDNIDEFQTFNGGDLRQQLVLDTWPAPDDDPSVPEDPIDPANPDSTNDVAGGCQSGHGTTTGFALLLLALLARCRRCFARSRYH